MARTSSRWILRPLYRCPSPPLYPCTFSIRRNKETKNAQKPLYLCTRGCTCPILILRFSDAAGACLNPTRKRVRAVQCFCFVLSLLRTTPRLPDSQSGRNLVTDPQQHSRNITGPVVVAWLTGRSGFSRLKRCRNAIPFRKLVAAMSAPSLPPHCHCLLLVPTALAFISTLDASTI